MLDKKASVNKNDTASVTGPINVGTTSMKIADANDDRIFFEVNLGGGSSNESVFIKLQPASADNDEKGVWIGRRLSGNDAYLTSSWRMPETEIYTGEISAISESGTVDIYVTEY